MWGCGSGGRGAGVGRRAFEVGDEGRPFAGSVVAHGAPREVGGRWWSTGVRRGCVTDGVGNTM